MTDHGVSIPAYQCSARTDIRYWAMFLVGAAFIGAGLVVDPASNCDQSGGCAPWLIPVALCMGIVFCSAGLGYLVVNPRRGSGIDAQSGELVWWQRRLGNAAGDGGRLHPSCIGRILIEKQSDSDDLVHLYDLDGNRQNFFDAEVIPWPYEKWAQSLAARWPNIRVEVRG